MKLEEAATRHATDKALHPRGLRLYEQLLGPIREEPLELLELGVDRGGSLLVWRDYLPNARIVGLDVEPVVYDDASERIRIYQGEQQDTALLDRIAAETAPEGFDVIIDDASHIADPTRTSFWHLFRNHLKPGGHYVIEDWGTAYWDSWPDGRRYEARRTGSSALAGALDRLHRSERVRGVAWLHALLGSARRRVVRRRIASHDYGMAGFVKQLVDECAMADITAPGLGVGEPRASSIERMVVMHGHVAVTKARE